MNVREAIKAGLRRFGYDIVRYSPDHFVSLRRLELLQGVTVVLDVGANMGQYSWQLRADGYNGRIVAFEPVRSAFKVMTGWADDRWDCVNVALGAENDQAVVNVAEESWNSSLLRPSERLVGSFPAAATVLLEQTEVRTLDSFRRELLQPDDRVFLKIDTQGYEDQVLAGAEETLRQVVALELELSPVRLYERQQLLPELLGAVCGLGFGLADVRNGVVDRTSGELLQVDALFTRSQPDVGEREKADDQSDAEGEEGDGAPEVPVTQPRRAGRVRREGRVPRRC